MKISKYKNSAVLRPECFRHCYLIIILIMLSLTISCTIRVYDTEMLKSDFKTEGFLDIDHFQVIITCHPDKDRKGLVNRRESAMENAKKKCNHKVVWKLSQYCLNHNIKKKGITNRENISNLNKIMIKLNRETAKYLNYGNIAFEYYKENHSAILVYRFFKSGLKSDIESINVSFKLRNK